MIPGIALMMLVSTFGIAFPLLFLPIATLALWSLFPAVLAWNSWRRWPLLALGLLLPAYVILGIPVTADQVADRVVAEKGAVLPTVLAFNGQIGVEIIRGARHNADLYEFDNLGSALYDQAPYFDLCERLLTGGTVAWVRIVLRDDAFVNDGARTHALFRAAPGPQCRAVNSDLSPTAPCILFARDHGQPADLVLDQQDDRVRADSQSADWSVKEVGYRTATAYAGSDRNAPIVFRANQLFFKRPTGLLVIDPGALGSAGKGQGIVLASRRSATGPIDLAAAFTALGFRLGPQRLPLPKSSGTEANP